MSTDSRIVSDLAIVGRASRVRSRSVEHTLRQLAASPCAVETPVPGALYAARRARIWSGVVLLIGIVAYHPLFGTWWFGPTGDSTSFVTYQTSAYEAGLYLAAVAAVTYVLLRVFLRRRASSRESFDRLDRWSVGVGIAAPLALLLFVGYLRVVLGDRGLFLLDLPTPPPWDDPTTVFAVLGSVIVASILVGVLASRVVRRKRWARPRWWVGGLGVLGLVSTVLVGLHYELGPIVYGLLTPFNRGHEIRIALVVAACVSLTAILSTLVLFLRRWELRAVDRLRARDDT